MLRFIFHWRRKIPGLKKYDVSTGAVGSPAGPSEIHLVATLSFDSPDALKARLASPEGKPRQEILPTLQMAGGALLFRGEGSLMRGSLGASPQMRSR
jgi:hypothetical protein